MMRQEVDTNKGHGIGRSLVAFGRSTMGLIGKIEQAHPDTSPVARRPFLERVRDAFYSLPNIGRLRRTEDHVPEKVDSLQPQSASSRTEERRLNAELRRANVITAKREGLRDSIKTHKEGVEKAKEVLTATYGGVNSLKINDNGRDIFNRSRKYEGNPDKVFQSKIRCLTRAVKKGEISLPAEVQQALQSFIEGQKSLKKDEKSLTRYDAKLLNIGSVLLEAAPAESPDRKKEDERLAVQAGLTRSTQKAVLARKALAFGMLGVAVGAALFISSGNPEVVGRITESKAVAAQAGGESILPVDVQALQAQIDRLTQSNEGYSREYRELTQQLIEAKMAAVPGYIPGELRKMGAENRDLKKRIESLEEQLAEAQTTIASHTAYPEHRWADAISAGGTAEPVNSHIKTVFASRYTVKNGDTLEGIARQVDRYFNLNAESVTFLLAQKEARDNRKKSTYLGTEGEALDTELFPGEILDLGGTLALAEQMAQHRLN